MRSKNPTPNWPIRLGRSSGLGAPPSDWPNARVPERAMVPRFSARAARSMPMPGIGDGQRARLLVRHDPDGGVRPAAQGSGLGEGRETGAGRLHRRRWRPARAGRSRGPNTARAPPRSSSRPTSAPNSCRSIVSLIAVKSLQLQVARGDMPVGTRPDFNSWVGRWFSRQRDGRSESAKMRRGQRMAADHCGQVVSIAHRASRFAKSRWEASTGR